MAFDDFSIALCWLYFVLFAAIAWSQTSIATMTLATYVTNFGLFGFDIVALNAFRC